MALAWRSSSSRLPTARAAPSIPQRLSVKPKHDRVRDNSSVGFCPRCMIGTVVELGWSRNDGDKMSLASNRL
jgi:hypothetical protein